MKASQAKWDITVIKKTTTIKDITMILTTIVAATRMDTVMVVGTARTTVEASVGAEEADLEVEALLDASAKGFSKEEVKAPGMPLATRKSQERQLWRHRTIPRRWFKPTLDTVLRMVDGDSEVEDAEEVVLEAGNSLLIPM